MDEVGGGGLNFLVSEVGLEYIFVHPGNLTPGVGGEVVLSEFLLNPECYNTYGPEHMH